MRSLRRGYCQCGALTLALLAGLLAGCAPKPAERGESAAAPVASHGGGTELKFNPPEGWIVETPTSSMRHAQYRLPRAEGDAEDGELAVFYFPGEGGTVQANLDRWVGQFSKADGTPAGDAASTTRREINGIQVAILDVSGTYLASMGPMMAAGEPKPGFRMLAAVAETPQGPWFFKLTGPAATIARWEESFRSFLETLH